MKKMILKRFGIAVLSVCMMFAAPAQMDARAAQTAQTEETVQTEPKIVEVRTAADMKKLAKKLSATWNESKKTLTLNKNVKLKENIVISRKANLTINMNGCTLSGGRLTINRAITLTIKGNGTVKNCQIKNNEDGTTVLAGAITYANADDFPVWTRGGTLKIMKGTKIKGGIRTSGRVLMSGGTVVGEVCLMNDEWSPRGSFTLTGGTIKGNLFSDAAAVTLTGGTVNGDMRIGEDTDYSATKVRIEGGVVNGQIVLASIRPTFTMTGGTIQSEKSPVIDAGFERVPGTADKRQGLGMIRLSGGTLISTQTDGVGICVYNSNVKLTGGSIQNTTGAGAYGIYNCTYTRQTTCQTDLTACAVTGFQTPSENILKKDHCGREASYQYDKETATLTVAGTGEMFEGTVFTDSILKCVEHVVIADGVTNVGSRNFYGCTKLKDVLLADSVTEIGDGAFGECTALTTVNLPSRLKTIGNEAFFHDLSLKEAIMPDSVESIGKQSFWECVSLEKLVLSEKLTQIPDYTFEHCDSLTRVDIPKSVTEIGHGAFMSCKKLAEVIMGENVKIGKSAFSGTPYEKANSICSE